MYWYVRIAVFRVRDPFATISGWYNEMVPVLVRDGVLIQAPVPVRAAANAARRRLPAVELPLLRCRCRRLSTSRPPQGRAISYGTLCKFHTHRPAKSQGGRASCRCRRPLVSASAAQPFASSRQGFATGSSNRAVWPRPGCNKKPVKMAIIRPMMLLAGVLLVMQVRLFVGAADVNIVQLVEEVTFLPWTSSLGSLSRSHTPQISHALIASCMMEGSTPPVPRASATPFSARFRQTGTVPVLSRSVSPVKCHPRLLHCQQSD